MRGTVADRQFVLCGTCFDRVLALDLMTVRTRRQIRRMFGEFFREAAVLLAVFAPLDVVLRDRGVTTLYLLNTVAIAASCFGLGIWLGIDSDD